MNLTFQWDLTLTNIIGSKVIFDPLRKKSIKMKFIVLIVTLAIVQSCSVTKSTYLKKHSYDLALSDFDFPQDDFNIIGFGAYHGSQKTENAELALIRSLTKIKKIKYYLPETDFSIAHYFNKYLQNGDTVLLKELVTVYGIRIPQERTIEVYEKWKNLKILNDQLSEKDKLKVVGIDLQVNYKFVSKHILELIDGPTDNLKPIQEIRRMVKTDTTSYQLGDLSYAYKVLKKFTDDYENNKSIYLKYITNKQEFEHIINNLKISFRISKEYINRDEIMYDNYVALNSIYNFKNKPQFSRMGFAHIEKAREDKSGNPYFFTRLIENNFYSREKVISIIGYFTDSKVVWDELYDEEGNYNGFTVEAGYGIGDYEKEYFRGIDKLKEKKISDMTLFQLNKNNSPYNDQVPDLIEVVMEDEKSNGENVKGTATTEFIDYAVLISNSKESTPIFELDRKK